MNNGDYPLGAKDDSSAPYNESGYTKHVTITLEGDFPLYTEFTTEDVEVVDMIRELVKEEINDSKLDYTIKSIVIE